MCFYLHEFFLSRHLMRSIVSKLRGKQVICQFYSELMLRSHFSMKYFNVVNHSEQFQTDKSFFECVRAHVFTINRRNKKDKIRHRIGAAHSSSCLFLFDVIIRRAPFDSLYVAVVYCMRVFAMSHSYHDSNVSCVCVCVCVWQTLSVKTSESNQCDKNEYKKCEYYQSHGSMRRNLCFAVYLFSKRQNTRPIFVLVQCRKGKNSRTHFLVIKN